MKSIIVRFIVRPIIALMLLMGCTTSTNPFMENLSPAEYFQQAYEAMDKANYNLALKYYQAFQEKYPDDLGRNLKAMFEIGFVYHKMGNDKKAIECFDELIARYNTPEGATYPAAPKALAEKVKKQIQEKTK